METLHVVEKESFQVIGYRITTTNQKKAAVNDIPAFWKTMELQVHTQLKAMMKKDAKGVFGINAYNSDSNDSRIFEYYIAVESDQTCPKDMFCYTLPKALWAIFPCTKETLAKTEVMAIMKYIPKAGYKPLNKGYMTGRMKSMAPDIEYYGKGDYVEVWVAVEKK